MSSFKVLRKLSSERKDLPFTTSTPLIKIQKLFLQHCWEECIESGIKIPATRFHDNTCKWISSNFCLSSNREIDKESQDGEEYMEQNLPVQEQSFESDSEPEEEARDTAHLINGQDS